LTTASDRPRARCEGSLGRIDPNVDNGPHERYRPLRHLGDAMIEVTESDGPGESPDDPRSVRLRLAFDLFEAGVEMERLRLCRLHPAIGDAAVEAMLLAWLLRVGEPCDATGREVPWPRHTA